MKTIKFVVIAAMMGAFLTGIERSASAGGFGKNGSSFIKRNQSAPSSVQPKFQQGSKSIGNTTQSQLQKFKPINNQPTSKPFVPKPFPQQGTGKPVLKPVKPLMPVKPGLGKGPFQPLPGVGNSSPKPIKPIDLGLGTKKPIKPIDLGLGTKKPNIPLDPGIGNGNPGGQGQGGKGKGNGNHFHLWLGCKPHHCHWWFHYCPTVVTYSPVVYVPCQYTYIVCDYRVNEEVAFPNVKFRLGVSGLFLPGKGMGIEKVEENSPAELNGLKPGMVIAKCNDVLIDNEEAFLEVMKTSNGVLDLVVVVSETDEPVELTIDLRSTYSQP